MTRTITIQATGKGWKALQALGTLGVLTCLTLGGFALALQEPGSRVATAKFMAAVMGGFITSVGINLTGRVGAWWFHG